MTKELTAHKLESSPPRLQAPGRAKWSTVAVFKCVKPPEVTFLFPISLVSAQSPLCLLLDGHVSTACFPICSRHCQVAVAGSIVDSLQQLAGKSEEVC